MLSLVLTGCSTLDNVSESITKMPQSSPQGYEKLLAIPAAADDMDMMNAVRKTANQFNWKVLNQESQSIVLHLKENYTDSTVYLRGEADELQWRCDCYSRFYDPQTHKRKTVKRVPTDLIDKLRQSVSLRIQEFELAKSTRQIYPGGPASTASRLRKRCSSMASALAVS